MTTNFNILSAGLTENIASKSTFSFLHLSATRANE